MNKPKMKFWQAMKRQENNFEGIMPGYSKEEKHNKDGLNEKLSFWDYAFLSVMIFNLLLLLLDVYVIISHDLIRLFF